MWDGQGRLVCSLALADVGSLPGHRLAAVGSALREAADRVTATPAARPPAAPSRRGRKSEPGVG